MPYILPRLTGFLAVAMWFVLVVECCSMAICFNYAVDYSDRANKNTKPVHRNTAALLVFLWISFGFYLITIPLLCAAIHLGNYKLMIPYVIWRVIFTFGCAGIGVALGVFTNQLHYDDQDVRYDEMRHFIPPIVVQGFLGILFLVITAIAIAKLARTTAVQNVAGDQGLVMRPASSGSQGQNAFYNPYYYGYYNTWKY